MYTRLATISATAGIIVRSRSLEVRSRVEDINIEQQ